MLLEHALDFAWLLSMDAFALASFGNFWSLLESYAAW